MPRVTPLSRDLGVNAGGARYFRAVAGDDAATERILALLADPPERPDVGAGYLDLIGSRRPGRPGVSELLMNSAVVPAIYERWWRPALGQVVKGVGGPSMAGEHRILHEMLALRPGDTVLDVACGPGNFTRALGRTLGEQGLAIGIDASETMLQRAVEDNTANNVGYVHGDAGELPFRESTMDAVCCYAALHLFADPMRALDSMSRVLVPGGRIALLTSCRPGRRAAALATATAARIGSLTLFGPDEITGTLRDRGFEDVVQQVHGVVQFVGVRRPA